MTENDYLYRIRVCENEIEDCKYRISTNNRKIDDIYQIIKKLDKISSSITAISESGKAGVKNLINIFSTPGTIIKGIVFKDMFDVFTGAEYQRSHTGINESLRVSREMIDTLNDTNRTLEKRIEALRYEITQCRQEITLLNMTTEG